MAIQQRLRGPLMSKFQITEEQADALIEAGLFTLKQVRKASEAQLEKVGVSKSKIEGK